jgi:hypothetical protein
MGEAKLKIKKVANAITEAIGVETNGGRIQVRWDADAATTPFGQLVFFIEFLTLTGLLERWMESCPLSYQGAHSSKKQDILCTWLLSILSGHKRYSHITTIRADGVTPELLGMQQVVSEDTVRRALAAIEEEPGVDWLQSHIDSTVMPLLAAPWVLDVDVTVKPLFGKQEGAVVGYNPHKPGRPSHAYHTYQMAGLRLILGVDVEAGNETNASHTLPGLLRCIDRIPKEKWPKLVRGDCGFGTDPVMLGLEERGIPFLFKLRLSKNVKRYIQKVFWSEDWADAGQGWEGREGELALTGWEQTRRVIILRRALIGEVLLADDIGQMALGFVESDIAAKRYEYAVLVTDLRYDVPALAQLYRDRADSENTFDELKNQWGWGGFTTKDIKRCRLSAMGVAMAYNWWSLFVRLANPKARMEAITSRPLLLSGVGRKTTHAGQQHLTIAPLHGKASQAISVLTKVSLLLKEWKSIAEQSTLKTVWFQVCEHIAKLVTGLNWLAPIESPMRIEIKPG